jgi:hypothetical protein
MKYKEMINKETTMKMKVPTTFRDMGKKKNKNNPNRDTWLDEMFDLRTHFDRVIENTEGMELRGGSIDGGFMIQFEWDGKPYYLNGNECDESNSISINLKTGEVK